MKTRFTFTFFKKMMLILCLVYLNACQKNSAEISTENKVNSEAIDKINKWLDGLKPGSNAVIPVVRNNLNFSELRFEKLNEKENLVIVPIKDGFKSAVNKDKDPLNHLVLIINEAGKIRKGNIVQFVASNGVAAKKLPDNTFHNFYNADHLVCDGRFTFLNLNDKILYQMDYSNGKLSAYGEKQIKKPNAGTANLTTCTDWFLVTTIYFSNGTVTVVEQYLYTSCSSLENELDGQEPGGGGGGESEEETTQLPVQKQWTVDLDSHNWGWSLFSVEQLSGLKKASLPGGGKFTNITHLGESLFIIKPENGYTWVKSGVTVSYSGSTAQCIISGIVNTTNPNYLPDLISPTTQTYSFSQVFP